MQKIIRDEYGRVLAKFLKKRLYLNTYMNITDDSRLEIENCKRIAEYNDVCVQVQTSTLTLRVWGQNLRVCDYNRDGIVVEGKFSSLEFL